jgi:transposase
LGIRYTVERILELKQRKLQVEQHIETLLAKIPEAPFLLSMKGVGIISAAILAGETGGFSKYTHAEEILKLAGLNLFEISSGKHKGKVHISKRGRPLLRKTVFLLATIQAKEGMPLRAEYEKLIKNMAPVKALIALSRKLVRVLFSLVRDKRYYCSVPPAVIRRQKAA